MKQHFGIFLLVLIIIIIGGCRSSQSPPSIKEQVEESYRSYTTLLENGINSMMILKLENGAVTGTVSQPSQEDIDHFFTLFTESPLCQDLNEEQEIIDCITNHLKENGCIRLASCPTCISPCK